MADMMSTAPEDKMGGKVTPQKLVDRLFDPAVQESLTDLKAVMKENNWPMSAEETFVVAQKDARTQGKTPAELAAMLREDPTIYDDLKEISSGKMEKMKADMGIKPMAESKDMEAPPTEGLPIPPDEAKMNFDQKAAMLEKKAKAAMPTEGGM